MINNNISSYIIASIVALGGVGLYLFSSNDDDSNAYIEEDNNGVSYFPESWSDLFNGNNNSKNVDKHNDEIDYENDYDQWLDEEYETNYRNNNKKTKKNRNKNKKSKKHY